MKQSYNNNKQIQNERKRKEKKKRGINREGTENRNANKKRRI